MANLITPRIDVEQFLDSSSARVYDKTVWNGNQALVLSAKLIMRSLVVDNKRELVMKDAESSAIFDDFLNQGFINVSPESFVLSEPLEEGEEEPGTPEKFPDGYYEFTLELILNNEGEEENYEYSDSQGFLAFMSNEAERIKMNLPEYALEYFITLHIYLVSAKAAASVGQIEKFQRFVDYVNKQMNTYKVSYNGL